MDSGNAKRRYGCLTLIGVIAVFWILSVIVGC